MKYKIAEWYWREVDGRKLPVYINGYKTPSNIIISDIYGDTCLCNISEIGEQLESRYGTYCSFVETAVFIQNNYFDKKFDNISVWCTTDKNIAFNLLKNIKKDWKNATVDTMIPYDVNTEKAYIIKASLGKTSLSLREDGSFR